MAQRPSFLPLVGSRLADHLYLSLSAESAECVIASLCFLRMLRIHQNLKTNFNILKSYSISLTESFSRIMAFHLNDRTPFCRENCIQKQEEKTHKRDTPLYAYMCRYIGWYSMHMKSKLANLNRTFPNVGHRFRPVLWRIFWREHVYLIWCYQCVGEKHPLPCSHSPGQNVSKCVVDMQHEYVREQAEPQLALTASVNCDTRIYSYLLLRNFRSHCLSGKSKLQQFQTKSTCILTSKHEW